MAAEDGRNPPDLTEDLWAEPWRFEFHQALRLLAADGLTPDDGSVRLRSRVGFDFPPSELAGAAPSRDGKPAEITVNFMGLAGGNAPLPAPVAEMIRDRLAVKDTGPRDFLDLFNHRLVTLLYKARAKHRPALTPWRRADSPLLRSLTAIAGLGTPGLEDRQDVSDAFLAGRAGLLGLGTRSLHGLERLLSGLIDAPVKGASMVPRWREIEAEDTTMLGGAGVAARNCRLGQGAVLGRRVLDRDTTVALDIGPVPYERAQDLLPDGAAGQAMDKTAEFYLGPAYDVVYRFTVAGGRVGARASGQARTAARLGWSSWLAQRKPRGRDRQLVVDSDTYRRWRAED